MKFKSAADILKAEQAGLDALWMECCRALAGGSSYGFNGTTGIHDFGDLLTRSSKKTTIG